MDNSENTLSIGATAEGSVCSAELVTISRAELEALLARADAPSPIHEAKPSQTIGITDASKSYLPEAIETDGQDHTAHLADEMSERDQRLIELERACKLAVCERDLATVLAGRSLVLGAASQLIKLWRDEFDVYEERGSYKVTARDGRTVDQVVSQLLNTPEYSHFCLPSSRGGAGAQSASRPQDAAVNPRGPKNLGEAVVLKWREESATRPENFVKPIGLRHRR